MDLTEHAWHAAQQSYSPYSHYAVGAAIEDDQGRIYEGANIENAAYGSCLCAERVAITRAWMEGARNFTRIAIVAHGSMPYPCGSCRQFLSELAPDVLVTMSNDVQHQETPLRELLPGYFRLDGTR